MTNGRSRLFLVSPPNPDPATFPAVFEAAAAAGDVASLLLRFTDTAEATLDLIASIMPSGYDHNVAIIVEGDAELAANSGADGVHIAASADAYSAARTLLGSDRVVGALSNGSRHAAMELGELGVDYIAFDQTTQLEVGSVPGGETVNPLTWWSQLFEVPCVGFDPVECADIAPTIAAGADFIRPPDAMWSSADRASETVRRYNTQIDATQ